MIFFICILFLLLSVIISKTLKRSLFCVEFIFNIVWCLSLGVSSLGLYGLYVPSTLVYVLSFISIAVFNIISLAFNTNNKNYIRRDRPSGKTNVKLIVLSHIIAYSFSIPYLLKSINIINEMGFLYLRSVTVVDAKYASTYALLTFQWILLPLFTATMIIASVDFARGDKNYLMFFLAVFDTILYAILFGGRYIIFKFILFFTFSYILSESGRIMKILSKHKKVVALSIVGVLILVYMTSLRSLSGFSFFGNVIGYYTGSLSYLSALLENKYHSEYLLFGSATFGSIINLIKAVGKILLGIDYTGSDEFIANLTASYLRIGDKTVYNALTTMLYPFILDFGYVGVVISTAIFAIFVKTIEKIYFLKTDTRWKSVYIFVLYMVFDSILKYNFLSPGTLVTLVMPFIFISREEKRGGQ